AATIVIIHERIMELLPLASNVPVSGELGRRVQESAALITSYRGYIWAQWFSQTPTQIGTLFAILLRTGGLLAQSSRRAMLFALSLPVSRSRLLGVRMAAGLGEWLLLAVLPSLVIPLLSPAVGQSYSVGSTIVHSLCLFAAGAVFFSLAFFLSTCFSDM